ncbi:MAG: hypothetical protein ACR2M7_01905 [Bdellovibrionales bacterium]
MNDDNKETHKIFMYSAIKIIANGPDPYSVLNPETNSDSPSARSNGVRFVSASRVIIHTKKIAGMTENKKLNVKNLFIL